MGVTVLEGDALATLQTLPAGTFQTCVTSPPYFGLRDYGHAGQIGLEQTPDEYVARLVAVFREVRRVLRDDGTLWLNIGDSYCSVGGAHEGRGDNQSGVGAGSRVWRDGAARADGQVRSDGASRRNRNGLHAPGYKPKDLLGIPWLLAFALRADGWYLRAEIIWAKPNPMPESVRDRPTKAHEQVFLLSKAQRYFYDADAIREEYAEASILRAKYAVNAMAGGASQQGEHGAKISQGGAKTECPQPNPLGANARTVWTIATQPFSGAHFATMPPDLAERCIKAGSRAGDAVLDPFGGAGTTGLVADRLGRNATLIELNPDYAAMARERIRSDAPLLHHEACGCHPPHASLHGTASSPNSPAPHGVGAFCGGEG